MRQWIIWTVIGVWLATGIVVLVLTQIHPNTVAGASLLVRQFSFKTNALKILSQTNAEQLLISGVSSLEIRSTQGLNVVTDSHAEPKTNSLTVQGTSRTSCSFENVSSSALRLSGNSLITLIWPELKNSLSIASHGSVAGSLTSQRAAGFSCRNVTVNGKTVQNLDVEFSRSGGDSLDFATTTDARIDFRGGDTSLIGDNQIPISDPLRISYKEPGGEAIEEKTVLLARPSGETNRITFDKIGREIVVDNGDLLVIVPHGSFYLRQFRADGGIALNLQGVVNDVQIGAGTKDLRSRMPSLFDHLDAKSRVLTLIPAIVSLVLGVLERIGWLPK